MLPFAMNIIKLVVYYVGIVYALQINIIIIPYTGLYVLVNQIGKYRNYRRRGFGSQASIQMPLIEQFSGGLLRDRSGFSTFRGTRSRLQ